MRYGRNAVFRVRNHGAMTGADPFHGSPGGSRLHEKRQATMTPISILHRQAETRPDQTAFVFGGDVWSYRRLATEAERLAHGMLTQGLRDGDRVALHMMNAPEMVVAYYACFRIGALVAPLNTRFKTAELRALLQRLQPSLYLGQAQLYEQVADIDPEILPPSIRYVVGDCDDVWAQPWAKLLEDISE